MSGSHRFLACLGLTAALCAPASRAAADAVRVVAQRPPANAKAAFPLNADARAVIDMRTEGERQVEALMATFKRATDEATRRAVMRQVREVKRSTEIRIIRLCASQARTRGDLARAIELEAMAEAIEHPAPVPTNLPQSPNKSVPDAGRQP